MPADARRAVGPAPEVVQATVGAPLVADSTPVGRPRAGSGGSAPSLVAEPPQDGDAGDHRAVDAGSPRDQVPAVRSAAAARRPPDADGLPAPLPAGAAVTTRAASMAGDASLRAEASPRHGLLGVTEARERQRGELPEEPDGPAGALALARGRDAAPAPGPGSVRAAADPGPTVTEQVAVRVAATARPGRHEISVRLDPPELGAVRIDVVVEGTRVTLRIGAELDVAREALERSLPALRESLAQHGLVTDRVTVHLGLGSPSREPGDGRARPFERPEPAVRSPRATRAVATAPVARGTRPGVLDLWV